MLDPNKKYEVQYVIPLWLRNQQIKRAMAAVKERITGFHELKTEPCAVVGYGPSLNTTWEEVKNFKYIFSCSGAHRFLIDRGVVPTWHVAVDPLPKNTVQLIGAPHPDIEYLIASTCHPDVFEHLKEFHVKLWHVFDTAEEGMRTLPHGEWAITGGCDVGLRSLTMARFFGFTDLHVFGLDGSSPVDTKRHAADHPVMYKMSICEYNGKAFYTTAGMLSAAQGVAHELDMMPDVKAKFYGEGLIQEMMKHYVPQPKSGGAVGFRKPELISPEYRALNAQLHRENLAYGVGGGRHADTVRKLQATMPHASILDYGCGKGLLAQELGFPIWEYDPAIAGKEEPPRPADLVICTDVLEHIEPEKLNFVLEDLKRCVKQCGYFTIHLGPAQKTLPDGRNTHLIQRPVNWWRTKLEKRFEVGKIIQVGAELHCIVGPLRKGMKKKKHVVSTLDVPNTRECATSHEHEHDPRVIDGAFLLESP